MVLNSDLLLIRIVDIISDPPIGPKRQGILGRAVLIVSMVVCREAWPMESLRNELWKQEPTPRHLLCGQP